MSIEAELPIEPWSPVGEPGKKRQFTQDFRRQCITYYDSLPNDGSKGQYLRRSGVFSSQITDWRRSLTGEPAKVGRKPIDALEKEISALQAKNAKLEDELTRAKIVIDVQKKVTSLLETHLEQRNNNS